jgi:hypothetical protein
VVVGLGRFSESYSALLVACQLSKCPRSGSAAAPVLHRFDLPVRLLFLDLTSQDTGCEVRRDVDATWGSGSFSKGACQGKKPKVNVELFRRPDSGSGLGRPEFSNGTPAPPFPNAAIHVHLSRQVLSLSRQWEAFILKPSSLCLLAFRHVQRWCRRGGRTTSLGPITLAFPPLSCATLQLPSPEAWYRDIWLEESSHTRHERTD